MDTKSLAHHGHHFTDEAFFTEVSELTGIEYGVLRRVFAGERVNLTLDAVKTIVAESLDATPEVWAEKLQERAKAECLGEYRPGYWDGYETTYEYNDFLREIGRL